MPSTKIDHTELFARIHIHGLTKSPTGEPRAVVLERRISFPMPVEISAMPTMTSTDIRDLSSRSLSPLFELEARVHIDSLKELAEEPNSHYPKGLLGQGRAGLVFPLDVLAMRRVRTAILDDGVGRTELEDAPEADSFLPDPPRLCLKVATPGYARALAREAWFYEQLDANGLTGVVSPRCYGVFQGSLMEGQDSITDSDRGTILDIPGYDYHAHAQKPIYTRSKLFTARMIEEKYDIKTNTLSLDPSFMDDPKGNYASSQWTHFREAPDGTNLTVLLMDQLGEKLTAEAFDQAWENDIQLMYDHLSPVNIIHGDGRFPNILRVPPHLQVPCSLHQQSHEWNLVDWENGEIHCDIKTNHYIVKTQTIDLVLYYYSHGGKRTYVIRT